MYYKLYNYVLLATFQRFKFISIATLPFQYLKLNSILLLQMSYIHNRELRTIHFARGCAINCTSALVSTDETLIATSCCEGDLCNTDLEGKFVNNRCRLKL